MDDTTKDIVMRDVLLREAEREVTVYEEDGTPITAKASDLAARALWAKAIAGHVGAIRTLLEHIDGDYKIPYAPPPIAVTAEQQAIAERAAHRLLNNMTNSEVEKVLSASLNRVRSKRKTI